MNENWLPWTSYADLTLDRILVVGDILRGVRDDCAAAHRPAKGEGPLTLGVGAWECSKLALCQAATQYSWLRVANGEGQGATHFIFQIGVFGVRFYHGSPEDPPDRYRRLTFEEKTASQTAFDLGQLPEGNCLRFAIVTGDKNLTTAIYLVEFHEKSNSTVRYFRIPLAAEKVTPFTAQQKEGVDLAPPDVEIVEEKKKKTGDE